MFEKARMYGKAYVAGTKNALSPTRLRAEAEKQRQLGFAMPIATTEIIIEMAKLVPEDPVPAATASSRRQQAIAALLGTAPTPVSLDRLYTSQPVPTEVVLALHHIGLDPALVYGVYPSTQLVHPGRLGPEPRWWEWCVLHAGGPEVTARIQQTSGAITSGQPPPHAAVPMAVTQMSRTRQWIERPDTAPLLFDEEAAAAVLARAVIDPAHCYGLSRILNFYPFGESSAADDDVVAPGRPAVGEAPKHGFWTGDPGSKRGVVAEPVGVQIIGAATERADLLPATLAPVAVPEGTDFRHDLGISVAILDWTTIALASQPLWVEPPADPTSFPRLPASPEELATTYLQLVGISPADCYGVSASVIRQQSAFLPRGSNRAQRGEAASMVAIVHRERAEHSEGRQRFERYRAEQLQISLDVPRPEVTKLERVASAGMKRFLRSQVPGDWYDELDLDGLYDRTNYPYLYGPAPAAYDPLDL